MNETKSTVVVEKSIWKTCKNCDCETSNENAPTNNTELNVEQKYKADCKKHESEIHSNDIDSEVRSNSEKLNNDFIQLNCSDNSVNQISSHDTKVFHDNVTLAKIEENEEKAIVVKAKPVRKIYKAPLRVSKIPQEILNDYNINEAIKALPRNYNFEIHKTIWRIREMKAKRVALQMPEGLLMCATPICDIIKTFTDADTAILGDVTYGACCIDDYAAKSLDCDLLIHYGHSCLIPINQMEDIKLLYIFVDIKIDAEHCINTIKHNFQPSIRIAMVSTIQFSSSLHIIVTELRKLGYSITVPQSKPLSPGEILGCTAPQIKDVDVIIYLGDGRFHLEAAMIANPTLLAYRYDPYDQKITVEKYDHSQMLENRRKSIEEAKNAKVFGLIFGTLGRQGSPAVLKFIEDKLELLKKEYVTILSSEIFPHKLNQFKGIDAFIQIACPRLSIDWGTQFPKPLLTPYEASIVLELSQWDDSKPYPMDFYASLSKGPWTPNHKPDPLLSRIKTCCGKCEGMQNTQSGCSKN